VFNPFKDEEGEPIERKYQADATFMHEWFSRTKQCSGSFEVRHPRCVGSITNNFCVSHNTVEHNYISPSSTAGIQLHVSALYFARRNKFALK